MKRIALWAVLGLALAGCIVPSVYPYYTEKDLVFDRDLVGSWKDAKGSGEDKEVWTFAKDGDMAYTWTVAKETETNVVSAHLFKLKGQLFLDGLVVADDGEIGIPPHYLFKVEQLRPHLQMSAFSAEWMDDYLKKNPDAIRHTLAPNKPGGGSEHAVLTADTKELQKFILKNLDDTNMFVSAADMKPVETK